MNKAQLIEKAKELGVEVDENLTKAQIESLLDGVQSDLSEQPEKAVRSQSGSGKSKYSDHAKFSKFKNKKRGN